MLSSRIELRRNLEENRRKNEGTEASPPPLEEEAEGGDGGDCTNSFETGDL